jgi:hypothetical protein
MDLRKFLPSGQIGAFVNGAPTPTLNPDGTITIPYDRPGAVDRAIVGEPKGQQPLTGPGANPGVLGVAPNAAVPGTAMPSGIGISGFSPQEKQAAAAAQRVAAGQEPSAQDPWYKEFMAKVKNGDFNGAMTQLGAAAGGGAKATSGTAPSPHPFQVGAMTPVSPPAPIKNAAADMMKGAGGTVDLRAKQGGGEQSRYDLLRRRGQQDALKGLLG